MNVRKMRETDLDAVLAIENTSHVHPWSRGVFRDCLRVSYVCDMFTKDDEIIVYGIMSVAAGESHIFNVCVNDKYRRQGFGQEMMMHLIKKAKKQGAEVAFLEVRPSNKVAIALYEKLGFAVTGKRKDYYPLEKGREDAFVMSLKL